jgi:hypothetical protein
MLYLTGSVPDKAPASKTFRDSCQNICSSNRGLQYQLPETEIEMMSL